MSIMGCRQSVAKGLSRIRFSFGFSLGIALLVFGTEPLARAGAEIKLDKDFLAGVIAKLPPAAFQKPDKYRGTIHSYRLVAIDPRARRFLIACQIEGEFHAPVNGPISDRVARSPQTPEGWREFRFDVKARVNIEPGADGTPRFRIEIDEVKKRDLDGLSGLLSSFLGQYFDDLVTQIVSGRASRLNQRLNDEVVKRVGMFKEYGVFQPSIMPQQASSFISTHAVSRRRHHGLRLRRATARNRSPLPLVPPAQWIALLHHPAELTRPAEFGLRGHSLLSL